MLFYLRDQFAYLTYYNKLSPSEKKSEQVTLIVIITVLHNAGDGDCDFWTEIHSISFDPIQLNILRSHPIWFSDAVIQCLNRTSGLFLS